MEVKTFTNQELAIEAHRPWVKSYLLEDSILRRVFTFHEATVCRILYNDGESLYAYKGINDLIWHIANEKDYQLMVETYRMRGRRYGAQ